jgi:triacylglycerol esterase/lipase EstA (alpha/beta hydrolase family)
MRRPVLLSMLVSLALLVGAAQADAAAQLPVIYNGALGYARVSPTAAPPGANEWGCRPGAAHPRPVVLVNGTFADMSNNWQAISPLLKNHGYCVYAFNYGSHAGGGKVGVYGTGDIPSSAGELAAFVDRVLAATGAPRVDLVGHSQGGMMPRYYLKYLGGATRVRNLIGLSPSNHGTDLNGLFTLASALPGASGFLGVCPACEQQSINSAFLTDLNAGGDTVPGVVYTVIQSRYDEVVTPYGSAFLAGPDVKNILLQNQCPLDATEHLGITYDHIAAADVLTALDPNHPTHAICTPVAPVIGG